ncbi:MAG: hypothetical protein K9J74_08115 [Sulfuritalea sp.]|nr:hypothetical protein [Sulfuritalea sp.]
MTTKRTNPRKDFTQVAFGVVQQATGEVTNEDATSATRKINSSKGGKKGGKTRMEALTEDQRKKLGRKAAAARWGNTAPAVKAGAGVTQSTKQR